MLEFSKPKETAENGGASNGSRGRKRKRDVDGSTDSSDGDTENIKEDAFV